MSGQRVSPSLSRRRALRATARAAALACLAALTACGSSSSRPPPGGPSARPQLPEFPATVGTDKASNPTSGAGGAAGPVVGRPMYQMDAQHTGRSPHAGPRRARLLARFDLASPELHVADPATSAMDVQSSAAIGPDGTIYISDLPGTLSALAYPGKGDTFKAQWRFHPPRATALHASPALGPEQRVHLGFSTLGPNPESLGTLYTLKPPAGDGEAQVVWALDLGPGVITSSPTLSPTGMIFVVNGTGKVFAVSSVGVVVWTAQTGPTIKAAPALAPDGALYVSSMDGKLYALAPPAEGGGHEATVRWAFHFGKSLGSKPLLTGDEPPPGAKGIGSGASPTIGPDGMVYVGANNSNFYAITPAGKLKWLFEAERGIAGIWTTAALSADGGTVYFGANKGGIYALSTRDGALRWQYNIYGSVYSSPALDSQGLLYTGSTVGHLFALDTRDGSLVFDYDVGAPVWSAPAIRPDGSLVVSDRRGRVLLFAGP